VIHMGLLLGLIRGDFAPHGGCGHDVDLRAMNIIHEAAKERGTTILIPTSMVDSMKTAA
jgi:hypothetical protein